MEDTTPELEALKLAYDYLVNSIDASELLPGALSKNLITHRQKEECSEAVGQHKKAEKLLEYLIRKVSSDRSNFYTFVGLLDQKSASRLQGELSHAKKNMGENLSSPDGDPQPTIVPEPLLEELADLRVKYARLLRSYKKEVQKSPEALEEFVETVQTVLDRRTSERIFQSLFDTFVEEEVSIFNTFYLKKFCDIFPEDVSVTTKQLVEDFEKDRKVFMTGANVNQFMGLFPTSATSSTLLAEKQQLKLKLLKKWGENTLNELTDLIFLFGVPVEHFHLYKAKNGCIAVSWLVSISQSAILKSAILEAADLLRTKGVLQVYIEEEIILECLDPEIEKWIQRSIRMGFIMNNEEELATLLRAMEQRWQSFSRKLGLSIETINGIDHTCSTEGDCLKNALAVWLSGDYNQHVYGPPTLRSLCAAIANSQGGGNKELAKRIAQIPKDGVFRWPEIIDAQVREWVKNSDTLDIMITGKTGSGKTSLINGLIGAEVGTEGHTLDRETTSVEAKELVLEGKITRIWYTPGLQDGTGEEERYLDEMKRFCSDCDLYIYCINMLQTRFDDGDKRAFVALTEAFGTQFWTKVLFVLTFANSPEVMGNVQPHCDKKTVFEGKIKMWQDKIAKELVKVGVEQEVAEEIEIVPTGYRKPLPDCWVLPGIPNWFENFWYKCAEAMDARALPVLIAVNRNRFKAPEDITEEDLMKSRIEEQVIPIRVQRSAAATKLGVTIGATIGATIGGIICALAGPVGMAGGIAAEYWKYKGSD